MKESLSRFTLNDIASLACFEGSSLLYLYMNALMIGRALDNTIITDNSFPIDSIMDNIIMRQEKVLEDIDNFGYLIFRIGLSIILTAASLKVSAEQDAAGVSWIVSPSLFVGLIAVKTQSQHFQMPKY
jgi:hypothetical protein